MDRYDAEREAKIVIDKIQKANVLVEETRRTMIILEHINDILRQNSINSTSGISLYLAGDRALWKDLYETFSRYAIRLVNEHSV